MGSLTSDACLDLLRSAGPERMSLLKKRSECQRFKHNKNIGQPIQRHAQLFEIANTAIAQMVDLRKGLSEILISQNGDKVALTWEVSGISKKKKNPSLHPDMPKYSKEIVQHSPA